MKKEQSECEPVLQLLGGPRVLGCEPQGLIEVHLMLARGLPAEGLTHLLDSLVAIKHTDVLGRVIPISVRAVRQRKGRPRLNASQTDATWRLAAVLALATAVLGSQEDAEHWLLNPAIGLDQHRPIDLVVTAAGAEAITKQLLRIDYCIYG